MIYGKHRWVFGTDIANLPSYVALGTPFKKPDEWLLAAANRLPDENHFLTPELMSVGMVARPANAQARLGSFSKFVFEAEGFHFDKNIGMRVVHENHEYEIEGVSLDPNRLKTTFELRRVEPHERRHLVRRIPEVGELNREDLEHVIETVLGMPEVADE
jgi:hypothetical protein